MQKVWFIWGFLINGLYISSWEKDVVGMVEEKHGKNKISVSFECETLKADKAAEDHIKQYMPKLAGLHAVGTYLTFLKFWSSNALKKIPRRQKVKSLPSYLLNL